MVTLSIRARTAVGIFGDLQGPNAPVITATALSSSTIEIALISPATDPAGVLRYELERSADGLTGWTQLSSNATFPFSNDSLTSSTQYYYRCRAIDTLLNTGSYSGVVSATTQASGSTSWQLEAGHFMPAKQAMIRIYPRGDAEVDSNARHRWAYYDGVNNVQYRIPIGVAFGSPPFHYELVDGPSGMLIGQNYGDTDYGILTWTPNSSVTNRAVHIRVTDQQLNEIDITWTVSTSSSTTHFIFVNATSGNNTNSGTIGSPLQTLAGAFGSTYAATANPGAICYLRNGTYTVPAYTDNSLNSNPYFDIHTGRKPIALVGFPGENPLINFAAVSVRAIAAGFNADDLFVQNITANGGPSGSIANVRLWQITGVQRVTFDDHHWTGAVQGTAGSDNATMFFGSSDGTAEYLFIKGCSESGRADSGGGNNYGFCSIYSRRYVLIESCSFIGSCHTAVYVKGTNQDVCLRYNWIEKQDSGGDIASEGFAPFGVSQRIEWCYNFIKGNNAESWHALESGVTDLWSYRNTRYGHVVRFQSGSSSGEYSFENEVIVTDQTPRVATGTQVTNTGTECQGTTAAGIVNSTSLLLTGSSRTNFLGTRGAEIA